MSDTPDTPEEAEQMDRSADRLESEGSELTRVLTRERKMTLIRWVGVAFGILQVETYYIPHPPQTEAIALSIVGLLATGNLMLSLLRRSIRDLPGARRLSFASLALDFLVIMGFVFVYTFDQETAIWALIYILPMEGALRFELRGALWVMGAATVVYTAREIYGQQVFGNDFLLTSISFRMGIGFIIGAVAGVASSQLVRERLQAEAETRLREKALAKLAGTAEALRESEERFRVLVEGLQDYALFMLDPQGIVVSWNSGAERITGYKTDQIIGRHFSAFYEESTAAAGEPGRDLERARVAGQADYEGWRVRRDGSRFWASGTLSAVHHASGDLAGFADLTRDANDRKDADEVFARQAGLMQLLKEVAVAANESATIDEAIQRAIDWICAFTRWPLGHAYAVRDEGLVPTSLWHVDGKGRFTAFREITQKWTFGRGEDLPGRVAASGSAVWVQDVTKDDNFPRGTGLAAEQLPRGGFAFPVFSEHKIVAVLEFFSSEELTPDNQLLEVMTSIGLQLGRVVERLRATDRLRASEQRTRTIVETARDAFISIDSEGLVSDWNRQAELTFGWTKEEVMGRVLADFIVPADRRAEHPAGIARYAQTGEGQMVGKRVEMMVQHRDGHQFPVELTIWPVEEEEGPSSFHAFVHDISERKRSEEELRRANEELAHSVNELRGRHAAVSILNEMGELLQTCNANEELYEVVARFARRLFPWGAGSLYMFSASRDLATEATRWGESPSDTEGLGLDDCWALRRGRAHVVTRTGAAPRCEHIRGVPFVSFCVPVQSQGEVVGLIYLRDGGPEQHISLSETDLDAALQLALTVSERLGVGLTNLTLRQSLRAQSIHDPLTGVFNRRYMEETLDRELQRASRHRSGLGLIMIDIDHFKAYNDRHGHEAGDQILRAVGEFLSVRVRAGDIVCRYGGEEFVLILPEASLDQTIERAEEIVEAVRSLEVEFRGLAIGSVTVSAGVAAHPDHGTAKDSLLRASDRALYRAKQEGRDRVWVAIKTESVDAGRSWRVVEGGASDTRESRAATGDDRARE